jgi:F-box/WD-40 domain protein MET30
MVDTSDEDSAEARHEASPPRTTSSGFTAASDSPPGGRPVLLPSTSSVSIASAAGFDARALRARSRDEPIQPRVYVHSDEEDGGKGNVGAGKRGNRKSKEKNGENGEKRAVLVSGSLDGTVRVWDVETGRERTTLFG